MKQEFGHPGAPLGVIYLFLSIDFQLLWASYSRIFIFEKDICHGLSSIEAFGSLPFNTMFAIFEFDSITFICVLFLFSVSRFVFMSAGKGVRENTTLEYI